MATTINNGQPREHTTIIERDSSGGLGFMMIVLLLVILGGGYWYFNTHRGATPTSTNVNISVPNPVNTGIKN